MKFTVLGGSGFVGLHLRRALREQNHDCYAPARNELSDIRGQHLGHTLYCIGMTADFREHPAATVEAHVCRLLEILEHNTFDSFVYLSSARLYGNALQGTEDAAFTVDPSSLSDLYNISKLMGESICRSRAGGRVHIARLSNVYGPDWASDNFITSIVISAVETGAVELQTSAQSAKDYISVDDAVSLLIAIAERGSEDVYNVASGTNTENGAIARVLEQCGIRVTYRAGVPTVRFPQIDVTRIRGEFAFQPHHILDDLPRLIEECRRSL